MSLSGHLCSEKSLENDRLRENLRGAEDLNKKSQEEVKLLLEMLTLDHHHASEEVQKEKEYLVNQVKELDKGSVLMDDYQILRNQLLVLMKERDKGMTQIEEKQCHDVEVEKRLLKAKAEVEVLTCQLSRLEAKLHNDEVINNKEKTKLRMRLRGTQAKLEAFTVRYKEEVEKSDLMNKKFEEAAAKLKAQLASYALEVLNLKKQLVAVKSQ